MSDFSKGFIRENPVFGLFLGLCPALAVTNQAINGLAMGVATAFVLVGSNVVVSLLRNSVPSKIRIPAYIMIIATFVTLVKFVMKAYAIDLYNTMGVFISLIVVNCIILGRAEGFASKNGVGKSLMDGLGMGIAFTVSITLLSVIREVIGDSKMTFQMTLGDLTIGKVIDLSDFMRTIGLVDNTGEVANLLIFILPAGGFIAIGLVIGLFNRFKNQLPPLEDEEEEA